MSIIKNLSKAAFALAEENLKKISILQQKTANEISVLEYADYIPNKNMLPNSKDWDISEALRQAHSFIVSTKKRGIINLQGLECKMTSKVELDISYVGIFGKGAKIDASAINSGAVFRVIGTKKSPDAIPDYLQTTAVIGGFSIGGDETAPRSRGKAGTIGFEFDTDGLIDANNYGVAAVTIAHVNVMFFEKCVTFKNRAYNINFQNCRLSKTVYCMDIPDSSVIDMGERLAFSQCVFANCDWIARGYKSSAAFHYDTCSFDYPTFGWFDLNQTSAFLNNCHVEGRINLFTEPPIKIQGDGTAFVMKGGRLLLGTGAPTHDYLFSIDGNPDRGGGVLLDGVHMHNLQTKSKFLATGTGHLRVVNPMTFGNSQMAKFTIENPFHNLFADGNFDGSSIVDLVFISNDTSPIVNPIDGANIKIGQSLDYALTGTKALKVTKIGAKGTAAGFSVAVPTPIFSRPAIKFYYKKPDIGDGTLGLNAYFCTLSRNGSNVPYTLARTSTLGTLSKTFTEGVAVDWTEERDLLVTTPHLRSPAWSTHLIVTFDLTNLSAGSYYFDKFFATIFG